MYMYDKCAIWITATTLVLAAGNPLARAGAVKRDVPFVPTPQEVVDEMLRLANVQKSDLVYDLGSGDGRIVITAARRFGAQGVGVDIDPQRIKEGIENAQRQGVDNQVRFINENLFKVDLRNATVVTLYLLPSINIKLRPKLLDELKPGTRVVSHAFDMGDWEADATGLADGRTVYFWIIPAKVTGTWNCTLNTPNGPQPATLNLQQKYQLVSGTAQIADRKIPLKDGKLRGEELTFMLNDPQQGGAPVRYSCRIDGNNMQGTAQAVDGQTRGIGWSGARR